MKIIRYDNIKDNKILNHADIIKRMDFTELDDRLKVLDAVNHSEEEARKLFDTIGIKYDSLRIGYGNIFYTIGEIELCLLDLSHGERYLMYLIVCSKTNEPVVAYSFLEILGAPLRKVVEKTLSNYENLIIVLFSAYVSDGLRQYKVEEI